MADFSRTGLSEIPSTAAPQPGVVDQSGAIATQGLANLVNQVGGIFSKLNDQVQQEKKDTFLGQHSQEVLRIANAVAQGRMSSSEGQTRTRALVASAIGNNPGLQDDILKNTASIVNNSVLGSVISTGSKKEQELAKLKESAVAEGYIPAGASEQQVQEGVNAYQSTKLAENQLKLMQAKLTYETGKGSFEDATLKRESEAALAAYASTNFVAYRNKLNEVMSDLSSNKITQDEAYAKVQLLYANVDQVVGATAHAGSDFISNTVKPYTSSRDVVLDMIKGGTSLEIAQNKLTAAQTQVKINAFNDPAIRKAYGLLQILGVAVMNDPTLAGLIIADANVARFFSQAEGGEKIDITSEKGSDTSKAASAYLGALKGGMDQVNKIIDTTDGTTTKDEAKKKEEGIRTQVIGLLDSVTASKKDLGAPRWNDLMSTLASSEFGAYATQKGNNIPPEKLAAVNEMVQREYVDHVIPLIRDEFDQRTIGDRIDRNLSKDGLYVLTKTPTNSIVKIQFDGAGVSFMPIESTNRNDIASAKEEAARLNKEVAPIINRSLRGIAHLSGTTDYRTVWEQTFKDRLLPTPPSTEGDNTKKK